MSQDESLRHQLVVLLGRIASEPTERPANIRRFQDAVWSGAELIGDERVDGILRDVAYDLDMYEPDSARRSEDLSLYGDTKLELVVREALDLLALAKRPDQST